MKNLQFTFQSFYLLNLLLGAYIFIIAKLVTSFCHGDWSNFNDFNDYDCDICRTLVYVPAFCLGYSFIIGIIVLSLWRILVYYLYLKVSNERKVVLLGKENQVMRSIQNFMSDKNNKHKVTSVVVSNYYENLKNYR